MKTSQLKNPKETFIPTCIHAHTRRLWLKTVFSACVCVLWGLLLLSGVLGVVRVGFGSHVREHVAHSPLHQLVSEMRRCGLERWSRRCSPSRRLTWEVERRQLLRHVVSSRALPRVRTETCLCDTGVLSAPSSLRRCGGVVHFKTRSGQAGFSHRWLVWFNIN